MVYKVDEGASIKLIASGQLFLGTNLTLNASLVSFPTLIPGMSLKVKSEK